MQGRVLELASYPVKGLSARPHSTVALASGEGFPGDRVFGLAKRNSGFDQNNPKPLPKDRFIVLLEHAALAGLTTHIDPVTKLLTVAQADQTTQHFDMTTAQGEAALSNFLTTLLDLSPEEAPLFAQAEPHRFTDVSVASAQMMHAVSLINLASVKALADMSGAEIDPARFRGNILIDGWPPFAELDLVGQEVQIGQVAFKGLKRTRRCGATRVNPTTAQRDLDVPALLKEHCGHLDMGLYLETLTTGAVSVGDNATVV